MPAPRSRRSGAPLLAGVIHGVRGWAIAPQHLLCGFRPVDAGVRGPFWAPDGEPTSAHCMTQAHAAPDPRCGCGLYGYHPRSFVPRAGAPLRPSTVTGVIEAWGRVELHEAGFRAKFARPLALFAPPLHLVGFDRHRRLELVAERYEVPLLELPEPEMAGEWCARRGLGLAPGVVARLLGGLEAGHA